MIKVAIIDDNLSLLDSLQQSLEKDASIGISFTAPHGIACLNYLASFKPEMLPEIILMDISMPKMDGIVTTQQISLLYRAIQVIMLTTSDEDEQIIASIQAGAKGYLLKTESTENIIEAIKDVKVGGTHITPSIARKVFTLLQDTPLKPKEEQKEPILTPPILTPKEHEILNFLAKGMSYQHIADKLFISVNTIKTHIYHIYEKLEVSNKTQAINKLKHI